jgi:hypothetical protein
MAGRWEALLGTLKTKFQIGLGGVNLKNSSGNLLIRNAADSGDAEMTASKVNVSGQAIDLNSDATGSGADWKYTLQAPSSGMTAAVILTLPVNDGTAGQVLQTDGEGNLSFVSAGSTTLCDKVDTTSLAFGSSSPVAMFSTGANDVIEYFDIVIDTPFDGTPSLSIGISGTTSKYVATSEVDLAAAAETVFRIPCGKDAQGAEALIATYSAGGATAGAARILVHYATPA